MANNQFDDREILKDALLSEKMAVNGYNQFCCETVTPKIRQQFLSLLSEEHEIQNVVFQEMQKRGWYPTPAAGQQDLMQVKRKYQALSP
ncbi:MAG: spore coat protein [Candidatus Merdivicinus sp.]|jgi:spore coat protein CotF